jgi:hypothetical protein
VKNEQNQKNKQEIKLNFDFGHKKADSDHQKQEDMY